MTETMTQLPEGFTTDGYIHQTDHLPVEIDPLVDDPIMARVKLFDRGSSNVWWLASYDPQTGIGFGAKDDIEGLRAGVIYLPEVLGQTTQRDAEFLPCTLKEILG